MEITQDMLDIFDLESNIREYGQPESFTVENHFRVGLATFYVIKYEGIFHTEDGEKKEMYACFFGGQDSAKSACSEFGSRIIALCEYQKITGKCLDAKHSVGAADQDCQRS